MTHFQQTVERLKKQECYWGTGCPSGRRCHPEMKTIFITGGRAPKLEPGQSWMHKPVRIDDLMEMISKTL